MRENGKLDKFGSLVLVASGRGAPPLTLSVASTLGEEVRTLAQKC